ncbi:MAG: alpha/beta hydrolase [Actinobacteria bacterium]|nr:alpha/beta hydrolase [Actinomycetota bacterium]
MPLHPQARAFLEMEAQSNPPDITVDLHGVRALSHNDNDLAGPLDPSVGIEHRYITSPTADLPINIYTPNGPGPFNALIYFHGGGWVAFHIDRYSAQLTSLAAKTQSVVIAVNYQKAPEHKFPIPFDDCFSAIEWTFANAAHLNIDSTKIGVGGDSAGGNLASAVALKTRDTGEYKLAYQLLIYPANGPEYVSHPGVPCAEGFGSTQKGIKWAWEQYLNGDEDLANSYAVPHAANNFAQLPPAIILTAEFDVLRQDGIDYARKLEEAGVTTSHNDVQGMIHGFFNYGKYIDEGISIRDYMSKEILKILSTPA